MRFVLSVAILVISGFVGGCSAIPGPEPVLEDEPLGPYDYPFVDPFAATVVGTPDGYRASLPARVPVDELEIGIFKDREVPEVFWYHDRLKFALVRQDHRAPLVFNIAGTGAGHNASSMKVLEKAFYQAGFHVISLPSPTHANFIVTASSTGVPGRVEDDAADLYRVMALAYQHVKDRIDVSEFYLTGYSLGGMQAAFVSHLDEERKAFNFAKVLLINPPVSLHNSIQVLDHMLTDNIPGGNDGIDDYIERTLNSFIEVYKAHEFTNFGEDFIYRAYTTQEPDKEELAAVVGLSFRFFSSNMAFTSDVMSQSGYVVPRSMELTTSTSLTKHFKVSLQLSFEDYLDELLYPYFKDKDPTLTREKLIEEGSLRQIEGYLIRAHKIGLLTNEDDIILAPGEIDYLKNVFGERARIFPTGGHFGNLPQRHVISSITKFFKS